jgi:hypothetical protein
MWLAITDGRCQPDHLAFQVEDHLPDLELARSPAEGVHRSDRPPDRGAACLVGPAREEMADRAEGPALVALGHSDFGPQKHSCRSLIHVPCARCSRRFGRATSNGRCGRPISSGGRENSPGSLCSA